MEETNRPSLYAIVLVIFMTIAAIALTAVVLWRQLSPPSVEVAAGALPTPTIQPTATPTALPTVAVPLSTVPIPTETLIPTFTPASDGGEMEGDDEAAEATTELAASPTPIVHIVDQNETLYDLAIEYGVTVDEIMQANGLTSTNLGIGQRLLIPTEDNPITPEPIAENYRYRLVGSSAQGREIEAFIFGEGAVPVLFVGGIHGGYEWNTVTLAWQMVNHFNTNPEVVPADITLHIIPVANPDGVAQVTIGGRFRFINDLDIADVDTIPGRFNGNTVDLNRNWDCQWSSTAFWRDNPVSAGPSPFSEPENQALRAYIEEINPAGVIWWHSALGIVAPGRCGEEAHDGSLALANAYSGASGYPVQYFTAYAVTGDASDWLASNNIDSVSIELTDHFNMEWDRNLRGVLAVMDFYAGLFQAESGE